METWRHLGADQKRGRGMRKQAVNLEGLAWQPTTEFRAAVRIVVTSTLAYYVSVVEALADEARGRRQRGDALTAEPEVVTWRQVAMHGGGGMQCEFDCPPVALPPISFFW